MTTIKGLPGFLRRRKGSVKGTWTYVVYLGGEKWERSTKETDIKRAAEVARGLYRLAQSRSGALRDITHLADAIVAEVARLEADVSARQAERVDAALKNFHDWTGPIRIERVDSMMLENYQRQRLRTASRSTVEKEINYVVRCLANVGVELVKPKAKPGAVTESRPFTDDELKAFFASTADRMGNDVLKVPCLTMLATGARPAEILPSARSSHTALLKSEVDAAALTVTIRTAKRSGKAKPRVISIEKPLMDAIVKQMPGGDFAFAPIKSLAQAMNWAFKRAGIAKVDPLGRKVTAHSFRHTYATKMDQRGESTYALQQALGHSRSTTTEVYVHPKPVAEVIEVGEFLEAVE